MSRKCELTGVGVMFGNKVSHSQRKTRRSFRPNIKTVSFFSETLGTSFRFRVNARCIKTVEKNGGLDGYMGKVCNGLLSDKAKTIKASIMRAKQS